MQYLGADLKMTERSLVCFQGKSFIITVTQVYAPTADDKETEVDQFYEDLQDLLELTPKKRCPFHHRGLECKVGSKKMSGVTGKFVLGVQNEAEQKLTEFCQENTLVIKNTLFQQHLRRWTSPDGQHRNHIDYIFCSQKWRSSI